MPYDAKNAQETTVMPKDSILDGTIVEIIDGKVKDFVKHLDKWEGDTEQQAIELHIEVETTNEKFKCTQVMTYNERNSTTEYAPQSNLGKFKKKYGSLPTVGTIIKVMTNSEGYGKIKLD